MAICNIFTRTISFVGESVKVEKDVQCPLHAAWKMEWQIYFTPLKINRTTLVLSPFPALFNRFQDACSFVRPFVRSIKFIHIVHRELDREYTCYHVYVFTLRGSTLVPINSFYERGGYSTKTKEISMFHRLVYLCAIQVDKLRGFRAPVETEIVSGKTSFLILQTVSSSLAFRRFIAVVGEEDRHSSSYKLGGSWTW